MAHSLTENATYDVIDIRRLKVGGRKLLGTIVEAVGGKARDGILECWNMGKS
jgi:hypothetical protein